MNAFIPITQVVDSYLNERGEYEKENYMRYLQIVLEGYSNHQIYNPVFIKTVELEINSANIAQLPSDYIDYVRVGVVRSGRIYTLTRNDKLYLHSNELCGVQTLADGADSVATINESVVWYGAGGGYNFGQYRFDKGRSRIYFGGDLASYTVIMEYVSDGISTDDITYVPRPILPLLKAYLDYIISLREKDALGRTQMLMQIYFNEVDKFNQLTSGFTVDEFLDAVRSGYSQGAKR